METIEILALTLGAGWAAGINLYAAVFMLGYLGATGDIILPPGLEVLSDPLVMGVAGIMYCIEFFADKTPGVDTGWDVLHTFVRIPAGAILAAGAASGFEVSEAAQLAAALAGGTLAARQPPDQGQLPGTDQHLTRTRHQLGRIDCRGSSGDRRPLDRTPVIR